MKLSIPLIIILFIAACSGDEPSTYETPANYSFERDGASTISYTGQTQRLDMLSEMSAYLKSATENSLDSQKVFNMFYNENSPFDNADLNQVGDSRKRLSNKIFGQGDGGTPVDGGATQAFFIQAMNNLLATNEANTQTATNGSAGTLSNGNSTYLVDENGIEWVQVIEKGLMGAVFFHQGTNVYLGSIKQAADNSSLADQKNYTNLEHQIDESYGYFELPHNPGQLSELGNSGDLRFWANYAYKRKGELPALADEIHKAYREIRACAGYRFEQEDQSACSYEDQLELVKAKWEELVAACAIHYMNTSIQSFGNQADLSHQLSEGYGFILSLTYAQNGMGPIDEAKANELFDRIGENFWEVTISDLNVVRDEIAAAYPALESVKESL